MTNNFTPKKSGTAARPQLSPEEYAAKKKAEKDAVYQMIDDTAAEIVSDPDKFRAYLDTQARMDRYSAANALLIYKQQPQATQLKEFRDWQEDGVKVNKGAKSLSILEPVEYTKNDGSTGIAYNVKKVFDVAQTSGKKPAAPTLDRDPRKLVAIMLDTAPIDVSTVEELPSPNMGAFYKNEDQTLYIKRDIGNSVALCQCVAQELGHAQLATELCDSPVDCNPSHDGDNSILFLASVYIEDGLESTPHNPCFLFGAKLVYGSCKGRM